MAQEVATYLTIGALSALIGLVPSTHRIENTSVCFINDLQDFENKIAVMYERIAVVHKQNNKSEKMSLSFAGVRIIDGVLQVVMVPENGDISTIKTQDIFSVLKLALPSCDFGRSSYVLEKTGKHSLRITIGKNSN